ncbi:MAG TPA: alpha/beta fold hydrolase [Gammaproteobacteria bacterium]
MSRLVLVILVIGLQGCTYLLFHPERELLMAPDVIGIEYDDIYIQSSGNVRLHGWRLHTKNEKKGTVLFFHGNAENISTHIGHVYWLTNYGYDVIAVDYRGYGHSTGQPQLEGVIKDIDSTITHVVEHATDDGLGFVVVGQSLGGSLTIAAVAQSKIKNKINAVVVVGAFSDYHKITRQVLGRSWLTWPLQWPLSYTINNDFSPEKYIADISPVPVLIMHGINDNVIPITHADRLFELAMYPKYIEKTMGDHNHIFESRLNRELLVKYLEKFLQK